MEFEIDWKLTISAIALVFSAISLLLSLLNRVDEKRIKAKIKKIEIRNKLNEAIDLIESYRRFNDLYDENDIQNLKRAKLLLEECIILENKNSGAFRVLGRYYQLLWEKGNDDKIKHLNSSKSAFKKALELESYGAGTVIEYASLLLLNNETETAIKVLKKCQSANPSIPKLQNMLGNAYLQAGLYQNAEESVSKAIALAPDSTAFKIRLGDVYRESGNTKKAVEKYKEALHINPNHHVALFNLGLIEHKNKNYETAKDYYSDCLHQNPNCPEAYFNLGKIYLEKKSFKESEKCFLDAIKFNSRYAEAHCCLGIALKNLGKYEEAKRSYLKAIIIDKDNAIYHYNLAIIFDQLGLHGESKKSYEEATNLAPNFIEAEQNKASLAARVELNSFGALAQIN